MCENILVLKSAANHFCMFASYFWLLQKYFFFLLYFSPINFSKPSCICKDSKYKGLCFQILTETLAKHQRLYLEHLSFLVKLAGSPEVFLIKGIS